MSFTRDQLVGYRDAAVSDLIGPNCRLLFVGINPGLWTAATNTHFCHPSNRFYPVLRRIGLIDWEVDTDTGMTGAQRADLIGRGVGVTNIVNRATVRASELSKDELVAGAAGLVAKVVDLAPAVVAIAGITAYRSAFAAPGSALGRQARQIGSSVVHVLPNPSGLNAHETIDSLAGWYSGAAEEAGVI
jgi:TDG/mug DNA glycosylase family protein